MKENFVTQTENDTIVKNVFIMIGYCIISILIIMALLWGYFTSHFIFFVIYAFVVLLYNSVIITFIVINKQIYDSDSYSVIIGTTIISMILNFIIICLYLYKYFSSIKESKNITQQDIKYSYNY